MTTVLKPNKAPPGEQHFIRASRLRRIRELVKRCPTKKLMELYEEVYGATPRLSDDVMRVSIAAAVDEMLEGTEADDTPPEPEDDVNNLL